MVFRSLAGSPFLLSGLLLVLLFARAQDSPSQSNARLFAPYIDMGLPGAENLAAIARQTGVKGVTLAFLNASRGACAAGWGGLNQTLPNDKLSNGTTIQQIVKDLQQSGVEVILSFGGQGATEPASTCKSAAQLEALYQTVIDRYRVTRLDFDLEDKEAANAASIALRNQALITLKKANPNLRISFTLAAMPDGLIPSSMKILASAKRDGLAVDLVNIMAMDYGAGEDEGGQMGKCAIDAAMASEKQIQAAGLAAKLGITVMIGVNDEKPEVFTLADAETLLDFARKTDYVTLLSFWSLGRDNGACAVRKSASPSCSGLRQAPYEFSRIFAMF
jgi:hypothetical protein